MRDTIIYLIRHAETVDENGIRNKNLHKAWMIGKYWHIHNVCDKIYYKKIKNYKVEPMKSKVDSDKV